MISSFIFDIKKHVYSLRSVFVVGASRRSSYGPTNKNIDTITNNHPQKFKQIINTSNLYQFNLALCMAIYVKIKCLVFNCVEI